ncbi:MAG: DNA methyltransferase, partial [Gammaproteobacteria bacterium]
MLFARFLAENSLLIEPEMGVAITLDECEELAKDEGVDKWALAARFAHHMLPQVFRRNHPVFEVQFAREYRLKLEGLVEGLPAEVFTATDALGWVYQFWQTKKKDAVNRSEVKIGADELPAVTQLFTEPYMVQFLLHNSLGAWWLSRHPDKACPVDLTYLRRTEDGAPAAGVFEGWPDDLSEFRLLDPCCGSGHFLVAAFLMLVPMRIVLEGLSPAEAVDLVLRQNLHGLELDQRCVAIAAFALALEAWRYPDAGGYRSLPKLNLAWCGQPVAAKRAQWLALATGDSRLEAGMAALFDTFRDAPVLGSLIAPTRSVSEDPLTAGFAELEPLLERALRNHAGEEEWEETAIAALGLAEATRLLAGHYHLVVTNVPYLTRGKQNERLRKFAETRYPKAKNDLANVFLERCLEFSCTEGGGVTQIVMPQNWLFLTSGMVQKGPILGNKTT